MRISHRHKFIFFANPKTGSSSLRQFLDQYSDFWPVKNYQHRNAENLFYPHITPAETRELFMLNQWDFDVYQKFVFVRNPWARLVSLYEHICKGDTPPPFNDWIFTVDNQGQGGGGESWQRWRRYGAWSIEHYIHDSQGHLLVDKVLRIEDINTALLPYLVELGIGPEPKQLPERRNTGNYTKHYSDYYNQASVRYVAERYRYDIENYDYHFEDDGRKASLL